MGLVMQSVTKYETCLRISVGEKKIQREGGGGRKDHLEKENTQELFVTLS